MSHKVTVSFSRGHVCPLRGYIPRMLAGAKEPTSGIARIPPTAKAEGVVVLHTRVGLPV